MINNSKQLMLETQDRYQAKLADPMDGAPDLLPGVILSVDRQKNRTSDQALPSGFDDALFQATTMTGVTLSTFLRYVDNFPPSLNPETQGSSPSRQVVEELLEELLTKPGDCRSASEVKIARKEKGH